MLDETAIATPDETPSPASFAMGAVHARSHEDEAGFDQPVKQYTIVETPSSMESDPAVGCESIGPDQGSSENEGHFIPPAFAKAAVCSSPEEAFRHCNNK